MIRKQTVLVLGAGASRDYEFPTGDGLRNLIIEKLGDPESSTYKALVENCGEDMLQAFFTDFNDVQNQTIDAFLATYDDFLDLGKCIVAHCLIPFEVEDPLLKSGDHLYKALLSRMGNTLGDFRNSRITILTYNYDRSLEQYLYLVLKRWSPSETDPQLRSYIAQKVSHLHGNLGDLPWYGGPGDKRYYRPDCDPTSVAIAKERILIPKQDINWEKRFAEYKSAVMQAERIVFIGFGYDHENLNRILPVQKDSKKLICGSAYGISPGDLAETEKLIRSRFEPSSEVIFGERSMKSVEFLNKIQPLDD